MAISKVTYPPSKHELEKIDSLNLPRRERANRIAAATRIRHRVQIRSNKLLEPIDRYFDSEVDAEAYERKVKEELRTGVLVKQQEQSLAQEFCPTIEELLVNYVEKVAVKLKGYESEKWRGLSIIPKTLISREGLLHTHIEGQPAFFKGFSSGPIPEWRKTEPIFFGQFYTNALTPDVLALYKESRVAAGISENSVRREFSTLSQAFNSFRELFDFIPYHSHHFPRVNPIHSLPRNFFAKKPRPRKKTLSTNEETALFDALKTGRSKQLEMVVRVALSSGMRRSEILNLQWENVDLQSKTVFLPDTKNGGSRTVPVLDAEVWEWLAADKKKSGNVFNYTVNGFKESFNRLLKRANLHGVITFHDFRRTFISRLAKNNNSLVVAELVQTKASEVEQIKASTEVFSIIEKLQRGERVTAHEITVLVGHSDVDMSQHYTSIRD